MSTNQNVPSVFPSVMRTVVPLVVGWVVTALTSLGVDFGSERTTAVVTVVISAAYYTVFRLLENAAPTGGKAEKFFGLLLGFVRPPVYPPSGQLPATARVETLDAPRGPTDPRV
ncbi:membrane protein [Streptomyces phage Galactica]|nr:membrane protein [Streptomyces phage Galactica]